MLKNISLDVHDPRTRTFLHMLVNTLGVSLANFTVWFAITFYTYIQTRSVFATGVIAGIFLVLSASTGIWFGSLVDHHKKQTMMQLSCLVSLVLYAAALALYLIVDRTVFTDPTSPLLWTLIVTIMVAVIAGNIRTIAMPTLTTLLIPADRRDKANGLVGTAGGVSMLTTSVISGLLVAWNGMLGVLVLAIAVLAAAIVHLRIVAFSEKTAEHADGEEQPRKGVDLKGTVKLVLGIQGLMALILFSTLNNFLGGVFMALLDAYGLELVSVRAWGLLWGVLSTALIVGGLAIAKTGLGKNPLRTLLLVNVTMWSISILFPLQASIAFLVVGMLIYLYLIPYAEAAEQTILQKVVPYERQGRVFGFAQSVEQAASPITAFAISPLAQFVFIPFMTTGAGASLIGGWFGTGVNRGIALVFIIAGVLGLAISLYALSSKYYRQLTARYLEKGPTPEAAPPAPTELMQGGVS